MESKENQDEKMSLSVDLTADNVSKENYSKDDKQISTSFLTKIDDIEIPTIFSKELESYETKGWREPAIRISDYFNYGFNEETWNKHCKHMLSKLHELKKALKDRRIQLPSKGLLMKYLFNFPADHGGLGEVLDEQKYDNLNFFEYKPSKNKTIPSLEVKQGLVCVPLESRNENLNINYNPTNNFSSINNNISQGASTLSPFYPPNISQNIPFPYYRPPLMEMPYMMMPRPMMMVADLTQSTTVRSRGQSESSEERSKRRKHKKDKKKKKSKRSSRSRSPSFSKRRSRRDRSRSLSESKSKSHRKRNRSRERSKSQSHKKKR